MAGAGVGAGAQLIDETYDSLKEARAAISECRRCPLYKFATQAVFGEGPATASIMFVGEQPGDQEDLQGRPFVGPAGQLFDRALEKAGIDRGRTYVTNAVKHFKLSRAASGACTSGRMPAKLLHAGSGSISSALS